jgi:hypothetical protein
MRVTTATLEHHLAAQGVDAAGLYSRGARVQRRPAAAGVSPKDSTEFLAVRVESAAEPTPEPAGSVRQGFTLSLNRRS